MADSIPISAIKPTNYMSTHNSIRNSFFLFPTSMEEVCTCINGLDGNKSPGPDEIPIKFIKLANNVISPLLSRIINTCFELGKFPSILKIAEIIPIPKCSSTSTITNYRPISLLSPLSKIFEKLVYERLLKYLDKNNILTESQFGFRRGSSANLAIAELHERLLDSVDNGEYTCAIFLDLAKAFDTVDHKILLQKLILYGIRGTALNLFSNYLSDRRQYVKIGYNCSSNRQITCGVPQGSVLGPLLFLIYVNDLPLASRFNTRMFADDTVLFMSRKDLRTLNNDVNINLEFVDEWMKANKLSLNYTKTKYMIVRSCKASITGNFEIKISETVLERTDHIKYLGIFFDENLSWKFHVKNLSTKIASICGAMSKLRYYVDAKTLNMVYYSLVYSKLLYGILSWGSASLTTLKPLEVMQNNIIRVMQSAKWKSHVTPLYHKLNLLKIKDIAKQELGIFMFKLTNNCLLPLFIKYFTKVKNIHKYSTRGADNGNYFLPRVKTNIGKNKVAYRGSKLWNEINNNFKKLSAHNFKLHFKDYMIEKYSQCTS